MKDDKNLKFKEGWYSYNGACLYYNGYGSKFDYGWGFLNSWISVGLVNIEISLKWKEVFYEEIKNRYIKEFHKRGFKVGMNYQFKPKGLIIELIEIPKYYSSNNQLTDGYGGSVSIDGKWSSIIEDSKNKVYKETEKLPKPSNKNVVTNRKPNSDVEYIKVQRVYAPNRIKNK